MERKAAIIPPRSMLMTPVMNARVKIERFGIPKKVVVAAGLAFSVALAGCGTGSEKPSNSLRESLAHRAGAGFEVLSPQQEKDLGIDRLTPEKLTKRQFENLLYLNAKGESDYDRVKQFVFPMDSVEHAGRTAHFSLHATGKPATVITLKGFDVREVAYVDNRDNKAEVESFYTGRDNTSKTGDENTTRVFWGVDSIIMDVY